MALQLRIKRLSAQAIMPKYQTPGAGCFDIHAVLDQYAESAHSATGTLVVGTGLAVEVPEGWVLAIYSRSGQGFNDNTRLANCVGIIDSDYRGEVKVKLTRDDGGMISVKQGERVAQAKLEPAPRVELIEVDQLSDTARGTGGFGSTGAAA